MDTADFVVPPIGKTFLITIWIEALLYGINCVVYGLCMFVLLRRRRRRDLASCWVLPLTSTILFMGCTIHVAASLVQLLDAFINAPPGVPEYADLFFLMVASPTRLLQNWTYVVLIFVQDCVLIWRLYVIFGHNWRVIAVPVVLEIAEIAIPIVSNVILVLPNFESYQSRLIALAIASGTLNLTLNIFVTVAIAARLWWMGRVMSSLQSIRPSSSPYSSSMRVIIESGAIFFATLVVLLAFYITETDDGGFVLALLDPSSQLAALTPLLIVVRVGLQLTPNSSGASQSRFMSWVPNSDPHDTTTVEVGASVEHAVELYRIPSRRQPFVEDKV